MADEKGYCLVISKNLSYNRGGRKGFQFSFNRIPASELEEQDASVANTIEYEFINFSSTHIAVINNLMPLSVGDQDAGLAGGRQKFTVDEREQDDTFYKIRFIPSPAPTPPVMNNLLEAKISLTAAQANTLNSVPVLAIPAPPAGKAIEVISASLQYNIINVPSSNAFIQLKIDTATAVQLETTSVVFASGNTAVRFATNTSAAPIQLVTAKALYITADVDITTIASGTVDVFISYRLIDL